MKRLKLITASLVALFAISACNNDDNGGTTITLPPMDPPQSIQSGSASTTIGYDAYNRITQISTTSLSETKTSQISYANTTSNIVSQIKTSGTKNGESYEYTEYFVYDQSSNKLYVNSSPTATNGNVATISVAGNNAAPQFQIAYADGTVEKYSYSYNCLVRSEAGTQVIDYKYDTNQVGIFGASGTGIEIILYLKLISPELYTAYRVAQASGSKTATYSWSNFDAKSYPNTLAINGVNGTEEFSDTYLISYIDAKPVY